MFALIEVLAESTKVKCFSDKPLAVACITPATSSFCEGEVVPIPRLPLDVMVNKSLVPTAGPSKLVPSYANLKVVPVSSIPIA